MRLMALGINYVFDIIEDIETKKLPIGGFFVSKKRHRVTIF